MNYSQEATRRWPTARIIGSGRYAVTTNDPRGVVYLATTESQSRSIGLGIDAPLFFDLVPTPCPDLADDWEDRQHERHEKRVQNFRAKY